jgi:hypothetical protein
VRLPAAPRCRNRPSNDPTTIDYVNLGIAVAGAVLALVAIAWQAAK